jgi:putative Holliday junction resolvase
MKKILAVDMGLKRIGLCLCLMQKITTPLNGILRKNAIQGAKEVDKIAKEYDCDIIVLGMPEQNNSMAKSVEHFKSLLKFENKANKKIVYIKEDISSLEANEIMVNNRANKKTKKKLNNKDTKIDSLSACIILKRYLGEI